MIVFSSLARMTSTDRGLRVKRLILLKIQNMINIKEELLQWFIKFLIKSPKVEVLNLPLMMKLKKGRISSRIAQIIY